MVPVNFYFSWKLLESFFPVDQPSSQPNFSESSIIAPLIITEPSPAEKLVRAINRGNAWLIHTELLHYIDRSDSFDTEMIQAALNVLFPSKERVQQIKMLFSKIVFYQLSPSFSDNLPKLFQVFVAMVHEDEILTLLEAADRSGHRFFAYCIDHLEIESFIECWSRIPQRLRKQALKLPYSEEEDLLHAITSSYRTYDSSSSKTFLQVVVNSLLQEERTAIVMQTDRDGKTPLHHAITEENLACILESVPIEKRFSFMLTCDHEGKTVVNTTAAYGRLSRMQFLFSQLPGTNFEEFVNQQDGTGKNLLYYAFWSLNTELIQWIVEQLSPEGQEVVVALIERFNIEDPQRFENILRCVYPMMPHHLAHLAVPFGMKQITKKAQQHFYLLGKSRSFLEEKAALLIEYTSKTDPSCSMQKVKIKEVQQAEDLTQGFTHVLSLNRIVPRTVSELYHLFSQDGPAINCHDGAVAITGIASAFLRLDSPLSVMEGTAQKVPLAELSQGDLVFLSRGPKGSLYPGSQGAHSFVFLSHDFCLSINGLGNPLEFCLTTMVLRAYGYPGDVLTSQDADPKCLKKIQIFRKIVQ